MYKLGIINCEDVLHNIPLNNYNCLDILFPFASNYTLVFKCFRIFNERYI
jgi:hypothetical protein